ncbi:hypothetical protein Entas_1414 [Enterobacter soli]|nr:hypothetical protein Entas_1414 [Enterobacter soli]
MSPLRESRMVEGEPGQTYHLTAILSVLLQWGGRLYCVTTGTFRRS